MLLELITRDFSFLPITRKREEHIKNFLLKNNKIPNWDSFLESDIKGFSYLKKAFLNKKVLEAKEALKNRDFLFFKKHLRNKLLLLDQKNELFDINIIYFDIEAENRYDPLIIGIFDGVEYKAFIKGHNLSSSFILDYFEKADLIVSFNGSSFDSILLKKYFGFSFKEKHLDLYKILLKLNKGKPLKKIEEDYLIKRPLVYKNFNFNKAISLFYDFLLTKDFDLINDFLEYNYYDVINLEKLGNKLIEEYFSLIKISIN